MRDNNAKEPRYRLVVELTAAETKIREIIFNDIYFQATENETKQKVLKIIKTAASKVGDKKLSSELAIRLARSFKDWYRMASMRMPVQLYLHQNGKTNGTRAKTEKFTIQMQPRVRNMVRTQNSGSPLIEDYRKKLKAEYLRIATELSKQNGIGNRNISVRNLAEIEVRRQAIEADINAFKASGIRFVWVSSHSNCSMRCSPWQGRLYSLDGTTGSLEWHSYIPIETAINVLQYTKSGKAYVNGLFGFNCRHHMIPYKQGSMPPIEYSANDIKKESEIDRIQRQMEASIRNYKQRGFILKRTDYAAAKKFWAKANVLEEKYEEFCKNNNRVIYRERTQVMTEEIDDLG